ncbi:uncharacterized protein LOC130969048 [Arachis stenosperma]|uniref:uncharacterized protein LOC130969048 n=1 Tax=Arachis stenosperma TaxID=217475 RepID=UPI0025ACEF65|nr:uncharacterized protein LOC130969048 [Arachis stenosperma]
MYRSNKRSNNDGRARSIIKVIMAAAFGFCLGMSIPSMRSNKASMSSSRRHSFGVSIEEIERYAADVDNVQAITDYSGTQRIEALGSMRLPNLYIPTNPIGAQSLPPGIIAPQSDFHLRRLWGQPSEDLKKRPRYLVTFTVGYDQKDNIDAAVKKFSDDFAILLFHYDGRTSEWDHFEWSKNVIHVSARKQTKWWYAKRFLHPDIVASYEYIFIWDEDLGLENFNADEYIELVIKHGLEISQPGLEPYDGLVWEMTKRTEDTEVHKSTEEKPGRCSDAHLPPCAGFVEIMAPVFSRKAWRCVWYMIQNDLVHGWGLDFNLRRCAEPAHQKIGVVDSQWIIHQGIPSLGNQGETDEGRAPYDAVKTRCKNEWAEFQVRLTNADLTYLKGLKRNMKG